MKLYIGDKLINMSEEELDSLYLNEGSSSTIYKYNDSVIKIYKDKPIIDKLSIDTINLLKNTRLNRIILPIDPIFDDDKKVIGYSSKYIDSSNFDYLYNMDGKSFKREIKYLMEDIKTLSKNHIEIDDLHLDNIIYNDNKIYFIDPGSFKYNDSDIRELEDINMYRFELFIVDCLLSRSLAKKNRKKFENKYSSYTTFDNFLSTMDDEENIKKFVKRVMR